MDTSLNSNRKEKRARDLVAGDVIWYSGRWIANRTVKWNEQHAAMREGTIKKVETVGKTIKIYLPYNRFSYLHPDFLVELVPEREELHLITPIGAPATFNGKAIE